MARRIIITNPDAKWLFDNLNQHVTFNILHDIQNRYPVLCDDERKLVHRIRREVHKYARRNRRYEQNLAYKELSEEDKRDVEIKLIKSIIQLIRTDKTLKRR